jgi:hypothetical protein
VRISALRTIRPGDFWRFSGGFLVGDILYKLSEALEASFGFYLAEVSLAFKHDKIHYQVQNQSLWHLYRIRKSTSSG